MKVFDISNDSTAALDEVANALSDGQIALIPTDTVYGLAAHPRNAAAVARLAEVKHRDPKKPIAFLASDVAAVEARVGAPLPASAHALAKRFWPGALTMVIACTDGATEGFRVPDHQFARELIAAAGGLLRVTSANLSGEAPAVDAAGALDGARIAIDIAVDGGICEGGIASTVIRFDDNGKPVVLRLGAITEKMMNDAIREEADA